MSSRKSPGLSSSIPARFTLWYMLLFAVAASAVFAGLEGTLEHSLLSHVDAHLLAQAQKYEDLAGRRKARIIQKTLEQESDVVGPENVLFRILSPEGAETTSYGGSGWEGIAPELDAIASAAQPASPTHHTVCLQKQNLRIRVVTMRRADGGTFQIAKSLREHDQSIGSFRRIGLAALLTAVLIGSGFCYLMLRGLTRRVAAVQVAAEAIGKDDLSKRVEVRAGGDEVDSLTRTFNEMIDRIAALVNELKGLSSNVAHDLRAPLARIRAAVELAMTGDHDIHAMREAAGSVVEECDGLDAIISTMLMIAETESGIVRYERERVDIKELLAAAAELFSPLVEDKGLRLCLSLPEDEVFLDANRSALQRVIANLIDNAVKYTDRGEVSLSCDVEPGTVLVRVSDTGIGISSCDIPHIFDRFYRVEKSRSAGRGVGLGLCLVNALVKAHNGNISVDSKPGSGSTFTVRLPREYSGQPPA